MRGAIENIPETMEFDREFHISIARAAHNNFLFSIMLNMNDLLKEKLWINIKEKTWSIPGYPQKYLKEHSVIFEAIKNKDSKALRKTMYVRLAPLRGGVVEEDMLKE